MKFCPIKFLSLFVLLPYLNAINAHANETEDSIIFPHDSTPTSYYQWEKWGAGAPNLPSEQFADHLSPQVSVHRVPVVTADDFRGLLNTGSNTTLSHFLQVSDDDHVTHLKGAFPMVSLSQTNSLVYELIQLGLLPQIDETTMRLSPKASVFDTATKGCNEMFQSMKTDRDNVKDEHKKRTIPIVKPVTEEPIVMDIFLPKKRRPESGAVLNIPGSKGSRYTEVIEAIATAKRGVPVVLLNLIGSANLSTDEPDIERRSKSSIHNQTAESFLSRGLQILTTHYLMQSIVGVDPQKIVWNGFSIGTTYTLAACQRPVLAVFAKPFIPPTFIRLEDFAPMLVLEGFEDSFFWTVPKYIIHGEQDGFTPLKQTEQFMAIRAPKGVDQSLTKIITHDGNHDTRSLPYDMPNHRQKSYRLDGPNYAGLMVKATGDIVTARNAVKALPAGATAQEIQELFMNKCGQGQAEITDYGIETLRQKLVGLRDQMGPMNAEEAGKVTKKLNQFVGVARKAIQKGKWLQQDNPSNFTLDQPVAVEGRSAQIEVTDILILFQSLCRGETFGSDDITSARAVLNDSLYYTLRHAGGRFKDHI